jgi:hypothetical protein
MERVWGHVFTHTITLSEANQNTWFSKLLDLVQITQQQQLWVSETKVRLQLCIGDSVAVAKWWWYISHPHRIKLQMMYCKA